MLLASFQPMLEWVERVDLSSIVLNSDIRVCLKVASHVAHLIKQTGFIS